LYKKSTLGLHGEVCLAVSYNSRRGYESFPSVVKELYENGRTVTVEQVEELILIILKMKEFEERMQQKKKELLNKIFFRC
jgi:hypothetical protein